ncbi:MAG: aminopeptidase [Solirubrobacteraceae bacterium]
MTETLPTPRALAELAVVLGANLQPGQILCVSSEPGKEEVARAVAEVAYQLGAKFVDLNVFDYYFKRARAVHSDPELLEYVPPWYGERLLSVGDHRCALVYLAGPAAPNIMDGVSAELVGKDMLPHIRESSQVVNERTTNWTAVPCPTAGWAELVYPELEPSAALERLWQEIGYVCRLDLDDPIAAWTQRLDRLEAVASKLDALQLDALRFDGPGTDLRVGLFHSSRWKCARLSTIDGIAHAPNLPTEEVFTTPDPTRVEGVVTSTRPLFQSGAVITGLKVQFEAGRAVSIDADDGAGILRTLGERDEGALRLGEVALVDNESRIGQLGTVFYDTLLDENAVSHIALGHGLDFAVEDADDRERVNASQLHIDFMIGSDEVAVTGITSAGDEVPLLRRGAWQI